jgi:hypothetical protein
VGNSRVATPTRILGNLLYPNFAPTPCPLIAGLRNLPISIPLTHRWGFAKLDTLGNIFWMLVVIPKRFIVALLIALTVLLVSFCVLMGGYGLALGMQDEVGAAVFWWIAMACLVLKVVVLVLLVGVLAMHAISQSEGRGTRDEGGA